MKIIVFPVIVIVNFVCMWFLCGFLGFHGIKPIGSVDAYGYIFPPGWFLLLILLLSLIEYITLRTLFSLKQSSGQDKI